MTEEIRIAVEAERLKIYRECLSYYRDYMLSELEDDDECSNHPEEAKQIHTFANAAIKILLSNPALPPGYMVDIMPEIKTKNVFEKNQASDLFLFFDTLHDILFPKSQEA